jgi:hypothetical protein
VALSVDELNVWLHRVKVARDLTDPLRQQPQPGSKEELIGRTRSVLRAVQRSPERVRAYFTPEPVRYAA